jgi:hypothetical protein
MWWQIILDLGAVLGDGSGKGREKEQKHDIYLIIKNNCIIK